MELSQQPLLVEQGPSGVAIESAVIMPTKDGITQMVVRNDSGFTKKLEEGMVLGVVENAEVLEIPQNQGATNSAAVNQFHRPSAEIGETLLQTETADAPTR